MKFLEFAHERAVLDWKEFLKRKKSCKLLLFDKVGRETLRRVLLLGLQKCQLFIELVFQFCDLVFFRVSQIMLFRVSEVNCAETGIRDFLIMPSFLQLADPLAWEEWGFSWGRAFPLRRLFFLSF